MILAQILKSFPLGPCEGMTSDELRYGKQPESQSPGFNVVIFTMSWRGLPDNCQSSKTGVPGSPGKSYGALHCLFLLALLTKLCGEPGAQLNSNCAHQSYILSPKTSDTPVTVKVLLETTPSPNIIRNIQCVW